jgi:hypothetical protein
VRLDRYSVPAQFVALAAAGLMGLGGVAFAYWSTASNGAGSASSGSALALTLSPASVNANVLYPNATGDVVLTISNRNSFAVSLTQLTLPATAAASFTDAALTTSNAACDSGGTGVTWAYATKSLAGVIVAKKVGATNGTLTLTLTGGAAMSNVSDNNCQDSFFRLPNVSSVTADSSTAIPVSSSTQ